VMRSLLQKFHRLYIRSSTTSSRRRNSRQQEIGTGIMIRIEMGDRSMETTENWK